MSGAISAPVAVQGSYFYDSVPKVAAALDLQTAVANATALLNAQIVALSTLPTSKTGLAVGAEWLDNGVVSVVMP